MHEHYIIGDSSKTKHQRSVLKKVQIEWTSEKKIEKAGERWWESGKALEALHTVQTACET